MKILLDTNVLVYAYDPGDLSRQKQAAVILGELRLRGSGVLSAQSLAEFFSAVIRPKRGDPPRLTPSEALGQVELLNTAFEVYDLTRFTILEAGRGVRDYRLSYYDAQIWATAHLNQIPVIFSEDFQHGMVLEGVQFINPFAANFDFSAWLSD
jgi:predicted nucleic acid-binding protein